VSGGSEQGWGAASSLFVHACPIRNPFYLGITRSETLCCGDVLLTISRASALARCRLVSSIATLSWLLAQWCDARSSPQVDWCSMSAEAVQWQPLTHITPPVRPCQSSQRAGLSSSTNVASSSHAALGALDPCSAAGLSHLLMHRCAVLLQGEERDSKSWALGSVGCGLWLHKVDGLDAWSNSSSPSGEDGSAA
jgi:hypothetical protein